MNTAGQAEVGEAIPYWANPPVAPASTGEPATPPVAPATTAEPATPPVAPATTAEPATPPVAPASTAESPPLPVTPAPVADAAAGPTSGMAITSPWIRWVLLACAAVLAVYLVVTPGAHSTPAAWQKTATEVVTAAAEAPETVRVSGGYLPDRGLVFSADLTGVAPKELDVWLRKLLEPHKDRLGELARGETVVWQVHVTGTTSGDYNRLVLIPRRAAADPAQWISAPTAAGAAGASAGASPAAELADAAKAEPSPAATS